MIQLAKRRRSGVSGSAMSATINGWRNFFLLEPNAQLDQLAEKLAVILLTEPVYENVLKA